MADSGSIHPATPVLLPLIIIFLVGAVLAALEAYLFRAGGFVEALNLFLLVITGKATFAEIAAITTIPALRTAIYAFLMFSFISSVVLLWLIGTTGRKLIRVNKKMFEPLHPPHEDHGAVPGASGDAPVVEEVNPKWRKVLEHIASESPSDWKLAILEADIMLEEMLDRMGYPGQTIGEKLKMVERSDFDTLDMAWEAHKIRNSIAHEGSDFLISKEEAERVITMFERVFREFRYL